MVIIEKDEIRLNSRMEELNFGKTNYDSVITQQGLLATAKRSPELNYDFNFEDWSFSDVKSFDTEGWKNRVVYYCAKNPFSKNAKTLLQLADTPDFDQAAFAVCSMLTQAAKEEIKVPEVGAGGILVDFTDDTVSILFFPEDLFKFSVAGLEEKEYSSQHAHWLNASIYNLPSLCFERSVIAYKMITDTLPYPTTNQLERNADFLDNKFIPVQMFCKNIDSELAIQINKGLKLNANVVNIPGKRKKGKSSEDLTPEPDFPLELLKNFMEHKAENRLGKEEFAARTQDFVKKQSSKVQLKRKVRRNQAAIFITVAALIAVVFIVKNTIKSSKESFTSKGLTSTQTIQAYYYGVNQKDSILLDDICSGGNTRSYNDAVSNIYVISKMRQSYNIDSGFLSPGRWIIQVAQEDDFKKISLYGITGLTIDEKPCDPYTAIPTILDNPSQVTVQDGMELTDNQTITHKIKYTLIHTAGEIYQINLEEISGTITLTYKKDKWLITNFDTESTVQDVDTQQFIEDYYQSLDQNQKDVYKAVESLKEKYPWLPSQNDIAKGYKDIEEAMNIFNIPALQ